MQNVQIQMQVIPTTGQHEPLINNVPTPENVVWSIASVVFLIAGIGFVVWIWSFKKREDEKEPATPEFDPLTKITTYPFSTFVR